jgi:hypothetical protein
VRRRLFVALLAGGLLLVAGFTAAAVASGGSPFGLLDDQPATVDVTTTGQDALDQTTRDETTSESTTDESGEDESADDEKADEKPATGATATTSSDGEHRVTICHHTGSKKHPFHAITVDEHALTAHTGHGDTVGPCPATTPSTAPAGKHGKPKHPSGKAPGTDRSQRSEQGGSNGNGHSQRPGKHAGAPSN